MMSDHILLALLWIFYCGLHSVMAASGFKTWIHRVMGSSYKYYRLFYVIFSFVTLCALIYFQTTITIIAVFGSSNLIIIAGVILTLAGLILMLICIHKYFMSLSGLKSLLYDNVSSQLMITGIHKYVRHPLYLGTFIFIWGLFLLIPHFSLLIANTVITVYTLIGIGLEEKKLVAEYGDQYQKYMREVPKLWPLKGRKKGMV